MESDLMITKDLLFEQGLIESLEPERIYCLNETDVFPFSDYYGALILAERLVQLEQGTGSDYKNEVLEKLAQNVKVPNFHTSNGNLQDRILKLIHDANRPKELNQGSLTKKVAGMFGNSGRQEETYSPNTSSLTVKNLLFDLELIKSLDPANIKFLGDSEIFQFSDYYGALVLAEEFLRIQDIYRQRNKANAGLFEIQKAKVVKRLTKNMSVPQLNTTNGNLQERIMFLINNANNPNILNQKLQIAGQSPKNADNLTELTESYKPGFKFKLPEFDLSGINTRAVVGVGLVALAGVLTLGTVVGVSPRLRNGLGLPISDSEKVRILLDEGNLDKAYELAENMEGPKGAYLSTQVYFANFDDLLSHIRASEVHSMTPRLDVLMGRLEGSRYETQVMENLVQHGFVKYKSNIFAQDDYSTRTSAAVSHLTSILSANSEEQKGLEPEERIIRLNLQEHSILMFRETGNKVSFTAYENGPRTRATEDYVLTFTLEENNGKYQVTEIVTQQIK
ncbi:MAG: hypothetical protein ABIG93_03795 [archaeon]|nr:hypothetical protein [Nanoarchaeota archaeon]